MLATLIQRYDKKSFHFKNERLTDILPAVRCHIYDYINTIYQFIKPFFDNKMSSFEEYGAFKLSLVFCFCQELARLSFINISIRIFYFCDRMWPWQQPVHPLEEVEAIYHKDWLVTLLCWLFQHHRSTASNTCLRWVWIKCLYGWTGYTNILLYGWTGYKNILRVRLCKYTGNK